MNIAQWQWPVCDHKTQGSQAPATFLPPNHPIPEGRSLFSLSLSSSDGRWFLLFLFLGCFNQKHTHFALIHEHEARRFGSVIHPSTSKLCFWETLLVMFMTQKMRCFYAFSVAFAAASSLLILLMVSVYASTLRGSLKMAEPATNISTPASATSLILFALTPPSICKRMS